eukprot:2523604-Pyramimonas_sp.AAC.1
MGHAARSSPRGLGGAPCRATVRVRQVSTCAAGCLSNVATNAVGATPAQLLPFRGSAKEARGVEG